MKKIMFAAIALLGGCASVQEHCGGFTPGTPLYENCAAEVSAYNSQRMMAIGAALKQTGDSMNSQQQYYTPTPRTGTSGCYLKGEQISGFNKICVYDCMGSANATTIPSTSLCPISMN